MSDELETQTISFLQETQQRYEEIRNSYNYHEAQCRRLMARMNEMIPAIWALEAEQKKQIRAVDDGEAMRKADTDASRQAISALTPQREGEGLLADQQDTPPQSSPQASETDAANWQVRIIGLRDPITGKAFLARNVLSPPLSDEGLAMLEEAITNEMPEGFSVYHPEDMMFPVETMVEFWWPDGKREISAIDKDWTEAPFAYRIISEPAEASEDDEPKEVISVLTGDPAVEPESGLRGEPLPQSELDSQAQAQAQAQPQTKSEQSDNPPEEKFSAEKHGGEAGFWTKALEQDRKPQPGFIEGAVSKLFGAKEPA